MENQRNKPCEIDAINGIICAWGRKHGTKTPINDKIVEIVKQCQSGQLKPQAKNIELFKDLL